MMRVEITDPRPFAFEVFSLTLKRVFLILVVAGAVAFFFMAALKYFSFTEASYTRWWVNRWALLIHVIAGSVALFAGPIQFISVIRDRYLRVHRTIGYFYFGGVVVGSLTGYYLGFYSVVGPLLGYPLIALSTAWLLSTVISVAYILRYRVEEHRLWMTRSYILTYSFVLFRVLFELPVLTEYPPAVRAGTIMWFAWVAPILVYEIGRTIWGLRYEYFPKTLSTKDQLTATVDQ